VTANEQAEARRLTSAGVADLAVRQSEALAALDRALEARLGELDRAFAVRRTTLQATLLEADARLRELTQDGASALRQAGSGERRALHEVVAAELAGVEEIIQSYRQELGEAAAAQQEALQRLGERVGELELAVDCLRTLSDQGGARSA
jgi:hypothetical protein